MGGYILATMQTRLEKFSEREFVKDVERLGGRALKQNPAWDKGIPDRLCWLPRGESVIWFWAEWKRHGLEPDIAQLAYHKKLRDAGHTVYVFDSNREAREVLNNYVFAV